MGDPAEPPLIDPQKLDSLVARCVAEMEIEGAAAIDRLGAENPSLADGLRQRIRILQSQGLLRLPARAADDDGIGGYAVLEQIGSGGMGTVYLAEQRDPIHRRVAIKVIKVGMDTEEVVRRFEGERQALALMDHPCIAKVFEAGATAGGRPYFVMEHVPGSTITAHCDRNRRTVDQRLELFVQVCDAVQHAHHRGVIHRDIKPSNVLVTDADGRDLPKVIDFGIAKAISRRLTDATVHTELGRILGTPEYMSPEQAMSNSAEIDTRSDVYSLGVLLYELLTGRLPFDSDTLRRSPASMRQILWHEEARPPSSHVREAAGGGGAWTGRRTSQTGLERRLRGDLDWITLKALEKSRQHRYQSPAELAADIRRSLRHEPIVAGRPSPTHRLRKFVRRHRLAVSIASVVAAAVAATAGVYAWMWREAAATRAAAETRALQRLQEAEEVRAQAQATSDPAAARLLWTRAIGEGRSALELVNSVGADTPVGGIVAKRVAELQAGLAAADAAAARGQRDARMLELLDAAWIPPDDDIRGEQWRTADRRRQDRACVQAFAAFGIGVADLAAAREAGVLTEPMAVQLALAMDQWSLARREAAAAPGSGAAAAPDWRSLLQTAAVLDDDPWRRRLRRALLEEPLAAAELRALAAAPALAEQLPTSYSILADSLTASGDGDAAAAVLAAGLDRYPGDFRLVMQEGLQHEQATPARWAEAAATYGRALAARPASLEARHRLGMACMHAARPAEAVRHFRILRDQQPTDAHWWWHLGNALWDAGHGDAAVAALVEALRRDPTDGRAMADLGRTLYQRGRYEAALPVLHQTLRLADAGGSHCYAAMNIGRILSRRGDAVGALACYRHAVRAGGDVILATYTLGLALAQAGDTAGAMATFAEVLARDPDHAPSHYQVGTIHWHAGEVDAAIAALQRAVAADPCLGMAWSNLGSCLYGAQRYDDAEAAFDAALRLEDDNRSHVVAHTMLGLIHRKRGDLAGAVASLERALAIDAGFASAHANLAATLGDMGEYQRSVHHWELAEDLGRTTGRGSSASTRRRLLAARAYARYDALLAGRAADGHGEELLAAAHFGVGRGRHLEAARAYQAAFAAEPALADHPGRRLRAACAAAEASVAAATETGRRGWRDRAGDWLRAELAATARSAATPTERAAALREWQRAPSLEHVRGEYALSGLDRAEAERWRRLWADVRTAIAASR